MPRSRLEQLGTTAAKSATIHSNFSAARSSVVLPLHVYEKQIGAGGGGILQYIFIFFHLHFYILQQNDECKLYGNIQINEIQICCSSTDRCNLGRSRVANGIELQICSKVFATCVVVLNIFLANFKWKFDTMHKSFDNKFDSYQL